MDQINCDRVEYYELEYRLPFSEDWTSVEDATLNDTDDASDTAIRQTDIPDLSSNTLYEIRMSAVTQNQNRTYGIMYSQTFITRGGIVATKTKSGGEQAAFVRKFSDHKSKNLHPTPFLQYVPPPRH